MSRILTALLLILLPVGGAVAVEWAPENLAVYSNVCVHRQTGDLLGTRIALLRFADATYVYVQIAEGELETPQVIKLSDDPWKTSHLQFVMMGDGAPRVFRGALSSNALSGNFEEAGLNTIGHPVTRLPRSTEKYFPECR
jgi:hypothetical protein